MSRRALASGLVVALGLGALILRSQAPEPRARTYDCARVLVIGDSIGVGLAAHWGGAASTAVVGATSAEIARQASAAQLAHATLIVVSAGSNDAQTTRGAELLLAALQPVMGKVYYVAPPYKLRRLPGALLLAEGFGSPAQPDAGPTKDQVHPADYRGFVRAIRAQICP